MLFIKKAMNPNRKILTCFVATPFVLSTTLLSWEEGGLPTHITKTCFSYTVQNRQEYTVFYCVI